MVQSSENQPEPPPPPQRKPRLRLQRSRLFGMALISIIPLLALLGLFGERTGEAQARGNELELSVTYPERFRYRNTHALEVRVRNRGDSALDRVTVKFDQEYLGQFTGVQFTPQPERAYEVEVRDLAAGEERLVSAEIQAQRYGRHVGEITAQSGAESLSVQVRTVTFP